MRLPKIRLVREKSLLASPTVVEAQGARSMSWYPSLGGTNINMQQIGSAFVMAQSASYAEMYRTQPAVRSAVDYLARNIAQLGLKLFKRVSDDEREHVGDHPAAVSLRKPNSHTPGPQFIKAMVSDFLIFDNAYALKFFPEEGDGIQLLNIPPAAVGVGGQSRYQTEYYRVWRADGTFFDVLPEYMIHWRGYDPEDPRSGVSLLETLRQELAADAAARTAKTELDKAGLWLPGWIERPVEAAEWNQEGMERFLESWANMARDRRHTPVLEDGMEFKQSSLSPEQSQMLDSRKFTSEQVAAAFGLQGVPPENEEQRRQVYADVLPPLCEMLCAFLDLQILQQDYFADDHYFEFNLDEKQMSDDRIKTLTNAAGAPVFLRDEARARLNLPPLPDGLGQEPITPLNITLGGKPSVGAMPPQNALGPSQDGDHRNDTGEDYEEEKALPEVRVASDPTPDLPRIDNAQVGEFKRLLGRHFERQQRSVAKQGKFAPERWNRELSDDLYELLRAELGDDPVLRDLASGAAEGINAAVERGLKAEGMNAFATLAPLQQKLAVSLAEEVGRFAELRKREPMVGPGLQTLMSDSHPSVATPERLAQLRRLREDLGLPDEIVWRYAGFSDDEIDEFLRLAHQADLLNTTADGA